MEASAVVLWIVERHTSDPVFAYRVRRQAETHGFGLRLEDAERLAGSLNDAGR